MLSPQEGSRLGAPVSSPVRPDGESLSNFLRASHDSAENSGASRIPWGPLLLIASASALALGLSQPVFGQEATLPEITVEAGTPARTVTRRPVSRPAPAPQPVEPVASDADVITDTEILNPAEVPYYTPASVSTAGRGEIETFGTDRLDNVIRSMPGTFTRESASNPGVAVNIRGFEGSGRVNMMIDGVRQNFRFTGHEAGGFAYVDPLLLAGIDIQRGAVTTAGGGALAGTANFRTLDVQDILRPGQNSGALTSLNWGSNGVGWSEMGAAAAQAGKISVAGAISKHDENDYKNGNGIVIPYTGEDLISGLAKAHIDISPEQRLSFGTVLYNNEFVANSYDQKLKSNIYTMNYAYTPSANDLIDFRAQLSYSDVEMDYGDYFTGIAPSVADATDRVIEDNGWGFNTSNISRFNLGEIAVATEYGVEYFRDDVSTENGGVNPSGVSDLLGAYNQTTFSYGIWDLTAGIRYNEYKLEGNTFLAATNPYGLPEGEYDIDNDYSSWDPKVTLAAQATPWLQPYVTYSESMRAPTVQETLMTGLHPIPIGGPTLNLTFLPNPFLKPEFQKGWEFGFNIAQDSVFRPGDVLRLKADYYTQQVENYITECEGPEDVDVSFPNGFFAPPSISIIQTAFFCNNPGVSDVDGVEMEGLYDTGIAFGGFSYTYTHTDLPNRGSGLGATSYLPEHYATVTGGIRLMDQQWTIGMRGTFVSSTDLGDGSELAGYELADFFTSYQVREWLNLGFTVENLFDRAYTPALSTIATGLDDTDIDLGRGRTFYLSARAQF
ncbi:MAG: TonB-dependent receptor domain-containing protein [Methyloligella sp. ZOD6]